MKLWNSAIIVGNSDGIGLAITKKLLEQGWKIAGISRSKSPIKNSSYQHIVSEVQNIDYREKLKKLIEQKGPFDLCIFCAGIGELLNFSKMENDIKVIDVNLLGMIRTASQVIPAMLTNGKGHFVGISSFADELLSAEGPSYHASKAGFSNYLESLALALESKPVNITNVRFGFVDTKMAKGDVKPFMMSLEDARKHLLKCLRKKPIRYTAPKIAIPFVKFRRWMLKLQILTH